MRLKASPRLRFAGQITGVEGYIESAAIGMLAGIMAANDRHSTSWQAPPVDTAHGALLAHITEGAMADSFQPMNVNFGLMPELAPLPAPVREDGKKLRGKMRMQAKKQARQRAFTSRAREDFQSWQKAG